MSMEGKLLYLNLSTHTEFFIVAIYKSVEQYTGTVEIRILYFQFSLMLFVV